ncbi:MAG TPA: hypothetical protein VET65_06745, partial [Candidatus Limnocylindrales bacterium]|nr:hypothetical protein [Candidatus Limnocylindrales bacterium]
MLWGGTLMVAALVMLLAYLGHRIRRAAAIVAGIGFGLFIDELGKFITSDNNYFFRPAIALIYAVFVLLFLWWRSLERKRAWTEETYLANGLMLLHDAALHDLGPAERFHLVHWLRASGAAGTALLGDVERVVAAIRQERLSASPVQRRLRGIRKRIAESLRSPWAARLAIGVLCVRLLAALAAAAVLAGGGRLTLPDEPFGSPLILAVMLSILP